MKSSYIIFLLAVSISVAACSNGTNENRTIDSSIELTMKKNIGNRLALYPTPVVVVGAWVEGKVNWLLVGHVGVIGHDRIVISMSQSHYTNKGIKADKLLSVNVVDEMLLPQADYVGSVSGATTDKTHAFPFHVGQAGAPIIDSSPLVMECRVEDIYRTEGFDNFICSIANTYADEKILDSAGAIDYNVLKPVLFEFPTYSYLRSGAVIGKCLKLDGFEPQCAKLPQTANSIMRLAKIEVYPERLDEYNAAASEVGEISMRIEPGVLTMYAVAEKDDPCRITIVETYADSTAYRSHLQTPHFVKYKTGTAAMIKSLELVDVQPVNNKMRLH